MSTMADDEFEQAWRENLSDDPTIDLDSLNLGESREEALGQEADIATERGSGSRESELTDALARTQAEYANYRRRAIRDKEASRAMAIEELSLLILPIADDIQRARDNGELDGVFLTIAENLESALEQMGLERFGAVMDPFDPQLHEALSITEVDGISEPTVAIIFQHGWRRDGRIIRPARVSVAQGS